MYEDLLFEGLGMVSCRSRCFANSLKWLIGPYRPPTKIINVSFGQIQLRVWREIEADVDRVFIDGRTRVNDAMGMASLRRVLRTYSIHNPALGYCQGMNFVAGLLLEVRLGSDSFNNHAISQDV